MARVGISGLTGMIGKNLITQCARETQLRQSLTLVAFTRRESDTSFLMSHGIEYRRIDYGNPASFSGKLEDIEAFIHLAGLTKAVTPAEYYRANADGTAQLLDALSRYAESITHFIFISSTAASGPARSPERPKTEEEPCVPVSHYGRSKLKAEELLRDSSLNWTIIRLPLVFGPYDYSMLNMFRIASRSVIALFSSLKDPYTYMSAPDVGRFLLHSIFDERLYRDTYCYCYDEPLTGEEFFGMVRKQLGLLPGYRYLKLPQWVACPVRAVLDIKQRVAGRATIVNPDKIAELAAVYWIFSNQKLRSALGIDSIENEQAVAETVQWYRDHQLL
jgi:nucleoside-diphosphate-sugar epimerase